MTLWSDAIIDRLHRAQEHFKPIENGLDAYYRERVGPMRGEYETDDGGTLALHGDAGVPDMRVHTLIGELIHDMHSAVEHLAWQLVIADGGKPTKNTAFPVWEVAPTPDKKGKPSLPNIAGGISGAARTLVDSAQPYKWGTNYIDHPLWLLHQLWNIDKHRHIVARGIRTEAVFTGKGLPAFTFALELVEISEHGAEFAVVPDNPDVDVDAHATIEIGIHEPLHEIERPLLRTLKEIRNAVLKLVMQAEADCF